MDTPPPLPREGDRGKPPGRGRPRLILLCLAAALILFLSAIYIPPVGTVLNIVAPVPLAAAFLLGGPTAWLIVSLAGSALSGLLAGPGAAFAFAAQVCLFGWGLAFGLRRGLSHSALAVTVAGLVILINLGGVLILSRGAPGKAVIRMNAEVERATEMISSLPGGEEAPLPLEGLREKLLTLFPGMMAVGLMINALVCTLFLGRILPGEGAGMPPFKETRLPENLVWVFILSGFALWQGYDFLWAVPANLLLILGLLYTLQGLAVAVYLAEERQVRTGLKILGGFLILIQPAFLMIFLLVGLLDFRFDFRKKKRAET